MLAIVRPADLDEVLAICRALGRARDRDRQGHRDRPAEVRWHGASWSTCRRHRSPTTARSTTGRCARRPTWTRCRPTGRLGCPAARPASRAAADDRLADPVLAPLGHRPVRPLRAGQHRARAAGRRRRRPARETSRRRRRAGARRQRPVLPARPVHRRAAGARRGVPQRRGDRRRADRGHRLPELRLAGGPRGDVAVRGDLSRAGRGCRRSGCR